MSASDGAGGWMIAAGQTLQLDRARIMGVGVSRTLLGEGLAQVTMAELGLGDDELLLIPRHRSCAVLRPSADGGVDRGFGRMFSLELAATLAAAAIDPLPGTSAAAYRFSSRGSFAIWLLGNWLRAGGPAEGRVVAALAAQLPGGSALGWARREVFDAGRALPMIFAALARQGLATALLARLDPADVLRMREALRQSHALPLAEQATAARVGAVLPDAQLPHPLRPPVVAPMEATAIVRAVAAKAAAARAAGNELTMLPAAAIELLLALLHLEADPASPRAALAAAVAAVAACPSIATTAATTSVATEAPDPTVASDATLDSGPLVSSDANASHAVVATPTVPRSAPPSPRPSAPSHAIPLEDSQRQLKSAPTASAQPPPAVVSQPTAEPAVAAISAAEPTAAAPRAAAVAGFATDFAGLLFLFNAFLAMGLYGDFTRPADGVLALAPSRLLDRLALHWFSSPYGGDPLHEALTRDGADPPLPDRWQVEPAWLEAFAGEEGTELVTSRRHQTLWHPAGFPLADAPLPRRRRPPAVPSRPGSQLPSVQPARWLACLALYLDARIQRATDDPALGLSSLAIPGLCRISPERIDVDLALADLPLPLRLAGLDRDPGWLPAEGRVIAFHFQ